MPPYIFDLESYRIHRNRDRFMIRTQLKGNPSNCVQDNLLEITFILVSKKSQKDIKRYNIFLH